MKLLPIILLITGLALICGCDSDEEFSRYPSVMVPSYGIPELIRELSNENPERIYNAICTLGMFAAGFGEVLSDDEEDPSSSEYLQAKDSYRLVCQQLTSDNPLIAAASLRFLQLFAKDYDAREELVEAAIRIENKSVQVQFEQATLLIRVVSKDSYVPEPVLQRLLDSPSWIVQCTAYNLIGRLHNEPLRSVLVSRYQTTTDEAERSILIEAMSRQLQPDEALMLEADLLSSENIRMRRMISMTLADNADVPGVRAWLCSQYEQFSSEDKKLIFFETNDLDLQLAYLALGYDPGDKYLKARLKDRLVDKKKVSPKDLRRIDQSLMAAPQTSEKWLALKNEAEQDRLRRSALSDEMAPFSQEFMEQAEVVITKQGFSTEERDKLLKKLNSALKPYGAEQPKDI